MLLMKGEIFPEIFGLGSVVKSVDERIELLLMELEGSERLGLHIEGKSRALGGKLEVLFMMW